MSKCEQPAPDGGDEQSALSLDRPANDLVALGTDTRGHTHYWDRQGERIIVVDATHEPYTRGVFVYHRLEVPASDVVHVQETGPTDDPAAWMAFVAREVDGLDWAGEPTRVIDLRDVFPLGGKR